MIFRIIAVLVLSSHFMWGMAQGIKVIPFATLDSVANPETVMNSPMKFEFTDVDLGSISEDDDSVSVNFKWLNVSAQPVKIQNIKTGCDCTKASYSKEEVKPGKTGEITVTYYPKGHPGPFLRRFVVKTNVTGQENAAVLSLEGDVTPSIKPTHDYPYSMGNLLLKQKEIAFVETKKAMESIEVMNAGDTPLSLKVDNKLLPSWLSFTCMPGEIQPGEIADIEFAFDPGKVTTPLPTSWPVILTGINVPSTQRTIYIRFKK